MSLFDHVFSSVIGVDGPEWVKERREQARRLKNPTGFLLYEAFRRAKILAQTYSQELELRLARSGKTLEEFGREAHTKWTAETLHKIMLGLPDLPEGVEQFPAYRQILKEAAVLMAVEPSSLEKLGDEKLRGRDEAVHHRKRLVATAALGKTWAGAFR